MQHFKKNVVLSSAEGKAKLRVALEKLQMSLIIVITFPLLNV